MLLRNLVKGKRPWSEKKLERLMMLMPISPELRIF
jgi:hypothetical protein